MLQDINNQAFKWHSICNSVFKIRKRLFSWLREFIQEAV